MSRVGSEIIRFRVSPNASRSEITGFTEGVWQVKIAAPPVDGKANRELIFFISRVLGISKSSVAIIKGQTSRIKTVAVEGISREEISSRLSM